jgi:iron complex outermembrane receptor protein
MHGELVMSRLNAEVSGIIRRTLRLSSALALSSMIFFSTAHGQSLEFHVPSGDLKEALAAYVRQAGVQLLYREDDVRGLTTAGVSGTLSVEEALSRILAGTSLQVQRESSGAIAIGRVAPVRKGDETARVPRNFQKTGVRLAQADTTGARESSRAASDGPAAGDESLAPRSALVLDEVLVTGTHIRGADNRTLPLIVMDREFINSTGLTTTVQLIESLPQNFALVNQSVTGGGLSGNSYSTVQGSSINLRGVGEGTTLTLINGRRVPLGYDGSAVNIAALPMSASAGASCGKCNARTRARCGITANVEAQRRCYERRASTPSPCKSAMNPASFRRRATSRGTSRPLVSAFGAPV